MKTFFKQVLANVVGIMVFFAIMTVFLTLAVVSSLISGGSKTTVADNSVFIIELNGTLTECSEDNPFAQFMGDQEMTIALEDIVDNIQKAKENDKVKGIFLDCGVFSPDSYASLQEIRRQLADFKKSGKWIVAYSDNYITSTYYLASLADKVLINPQGMIDWHGMSAQPMFLKDAMAKIGVKMTVTKVGKYKSAPEMFTADQMSEPNREQVTAYLTGTWESVVNDVAKSRKISKEQLNKYADDLITFDDPKTLVQKKLVDKLIAKSEVRDFVKQMMKIDKENEINTVSMEQMCGQPFVGEDAENEIAIYYAYGDIVDEMAADYNTETQIVGDVVVDDLEALADDDEVKAVVLRINSGGGSAFASEKMFQAVKKLKAKKPVVVSMGGMAASGGYYMSCLANKIVAEETTLTGSIGIFGMFPDFSELITQKIGVKYDLVKTNEHSDFGTMARSINEDEMSYLNKYIERGYDLFLSRVAEGRKMKKEQVNEIAQGRVWLGKDAKKIGLVDEIGGIDKALEIAAKLAKIDDYCGYHYPAPVDFTTKLFAKEAKKSILDEHLRATLGEFYEPVMLIKDIKQQNKLQARIPFLLNIQ